MARYDKAQLEILAKRFKAAGVSRRDFMKIAAAAVAGSTSYQGVTRYVGVGSAAAAPRYAIRAQTIGPDDKLYQWGRTDDPKSFDFNLDLYCNGEPAVWSGLLTFDPNLNAVSDWAEKFEPNDDASVWTFSIRKDNKGWTNGDPVTAHDFIWSWNRQLDPANAAAYAGFLFDIKNAEAFNTGQEVDGKKVTGEDLGLKAIDDWTLEVTMQGPRAYFPQVVGYTAAVPASKTAVEQYGSDKWAAGGVPLVSSGPFKLDKWTHDVMIELSPNPGHWFAENIHVKKVYQPIIPAENSVLTYEKGQGDQRFDWVPIPAADLDRYQKDPELSKQLKKYVYPGIWMLVPSNGKPPFDKLEVRKALSHAIDRDRLGTLTKGMTTPAYCMVPTGVFGYIDDPAINDIQKFDKQAAMDALKGTEFEGGKNWPEITMHMRGSEEVYNSDIMANDIVAQLKENLGMDVKIQVWPENSWRPELFKNYFQLVWIRWWLDYPDPNNCYGDMFYSQKSSGKRQAWSNKQFDDLVLQGKAEPDPDKRLDIYKQAEKVIQEDVGYIPVVFRVDQYAFKPWLKDVPVNKQGFTVPDGNIYVWMQTAVKIEGRPAE